MFSELTGRAKRLKDAFFAYLELTNKNSLALLDASAYVIEVLQLQNQVFLEQRTQLSEQLTHLQTSLDETRGQLAHLQRQHDHLLNCLTTTAVREEAVLSRPDSHGDNSPLPKQTV